MPSEHRSSYVMTTESLAHLERVKALALAAGVVGPAKGGNGLSDSVALRWALSQVATGATDGARDSGDGARLRAARDAAQLGQRQLARLLGYEHHSIVGQMERGLIPLTEPARQWLTAWEDGR